MPLQPDCHFTKSMHNYLFAVTCCNHPFLYDKRVILSGSTNQVHIHEGRLLFVVNKALMIIILVD
ncbi:hypothetical protein [Brevibacillus sp. NRS-1366]|uniref:hypothetical protein n=1 Tax=Brevibacillus sp. NRS-1366 TaxID=3233899 RepID=UPI003D263176